MHTDKYWADNNDTDSVQLCTSPHSQSVPHPSNSGSMMSWPFVALYRAAILLYPRSFRRRFGNEMLHDFLERGRLAVSKKGLSGAVDYWLRSILQVVPSMERFGWPL